MNTITRALTNRIPVDAGWLRLTLCARNWHDYGRWEMRTADLRQGRTNVEVMVQVRECIGCGHSQVERV